MKTIFFVQKIAGSWIVKTIISTFKEITSDNNYYYFNGNRYAKIFKDFGWISSDDINDSKLLKNIIDHSNELVKKSEEICENFDFSSEVFESPYLVHELEDGELISFLYTITYIVPDHNTYLVSNINYPRIDIENNGKSGWIRRKDISKIEDIDYCKKLKKLEHTSCSLLKELLSSIVLKEKTKENGTVYANNLLYQLIK